MVWYGQTNVNTATRGGFFMKKITLFLLGLLLIIPATGLCSNMVKNLPAGYLWVTPNDSKPAETIIIERNELNKLCIYSKILTADESVIVLNSLEIAVEAHDQPRLNWKAAQISSQNIDKIWLWVERQQQGEYTCVYYPASTYRLVKEGKIKSETNRMLINFEKLDLAIKPGEKVILSVFGSFDYFMPAGTIIKGESIIAAWEHTAKAVRIDQPKSQQQYMLQ